MAPRPKAYNGSLIKGTSLIIKKRHSPIFTRYTYMLAFVWNTAFAFINLLSNKYFIPSLTGSSN